MLKLEIDGNVYTITEVDVFRGNSDGVQLLTQNKGRRNFYPRLSKAAAKQLEGFVKDYKDHMYGVRVKVFSIGLRKLEEQT